MASSDQGQKLAPNEDGIAEILLRALCENGGKLSMRDFFRSLHKYSLKHHFKSLPALGEFLRKYNKIFSFIPSDGNFIVQAQTTLKLCPNFMTKIGCSQLDTCDGLHLCKYFIDGQCKNSDQNCDYGHNVHTPHNLALLKRHLLSSLPLDLLRMILKFSHNAGPKYCTFYNAARGCTKAHCPFLHVCKYYIYQECKFSPCIRSHNFHEAHNRKILESHGIDVFTMSEMDIRSKLLDTIANKDGFDRGVSDARPVKLTPVRRGSHSSLQRMKMFTVSALRAGDIEPRICLFHLRDKCNFGRRCRLYHMDKPYQWQYREGSSWKNIYDNDRAEKAFSSAKNDYSFVAMACSDFMHLDFEKMIGETTSSRRKFDIRRLSTVSSVQVPSFYQYVTKWIWFWQDEGCEWVRYGEEGAKTFKAFVTPPEIEKAYIANKRGIGFRTTEGQRYELDFHDMVQCNLVSKTKRKVRRRPALIDWTVKQAVSPPKANEKAKKNLMSTEIPDNWDLYSAADGSDVQYVKLKDDGTDDEYNQIAKKCKASMPASRILSIERIQSVEVYDAFERKKKWMARKSGQEPKELQLFYGTRRESIKGICEHGFDCNEHRADATYGNGVYFATSSLSATETADGPYLLVCRVLVGDSCRGLKGYNRPPAKDPSVPNENLYDSCVDEPLQPTVYVIFKSEQVYPQYLIKYST